MRIRLKGANIRAHISFAYELITTIALRGEIYEGYMNDVTPSLARRSPRK